MSTSFESSDLPGLYQSANNASLGGQSRYFWGLRVYLVLLVVAALTSSPAELDSSRAIVASALFLVTLAILIILKVRRPDDLWYNGRAVAESVKTRSWRWMMRAEPYGSEHCCEVVSKQFISDLRAILEQNRSLSHHLDAGCGVSDPISSRMQEIRALDLSGRMAIYKARRIDDQSKWYSKKSIWNRRAATVCFSVSCLLHALAILAMLCRIRDPGFQFPVEAVATAAGAVLTWLQARKYNELSSSYSLAAHEIVLIKGESAWVKDEASFSEFVVNSEAAFSREHIQWSARKSE